jgi:peptidoglycan/LPS O-acetylase OafA/YrhL
LDFPIKHQINRVPKEDPPKPRHSLVRFGGREINSLTAVRGIAAWWVVFYHFDSYLRPHVSSSIYYLISKGHLAVDLFFCLSGFVIFFNYGSLNLGDKREVFRVYFRRLAKIYPLHIFVLCMYGLLIFVLMLTHRDLGERFSGLGFLLNLFLIQDWGVLRELTWNIPSWSISAEFAAYLLFPAVTLLIRFVASRMWHLLLVIVFFLVLLNVFYSSVDYRIGSGIEVLGVPRAATQFAIGAVLARIYLGAPSVQPFSQLCLYVLSAVFLFMGFNVLETVFIPLAWAVLVLAIAWGDHALGWLNHRWLVFVGHVSYATYMVHYFARDVFKLVLVRGDGTTSLYLVFAIFFVIFFASALLYKLVERPAQIFLNEKIKRRSFAKWQKA